MIIGTPKCKDTQKAKRFFTDRGKSFHLRDINVKPPTKKELENIARGDIESLIDTDSKAYKEGGYSHRIYEPLEELLEKPELMVTPIIRYGKDSVIGFDDKSIKKLLDK
ncbi:MAG: hypothetical protein Kapaf2KO_13720 [Candidatus Kapaibacteriales bacterium]